MTIMGKQWYLDQATLCYKIAHYGYGRNHVAPSYKELADRGFHTLGCTVRLDPKEIRMYHLFLSLSLEDYVNELSS